MDLTCQEVQRFLGYSRGEENISPEKKQEALVHLEKCNACVANVCRKAVVHWIQVPGFHLKQPTDSFALWCVDHVITKECKVIFCKTLRSHWAAQRADVDSWAAGQNSMFLLYVSGGEGVPWPYLPALLGYLIDLISEAEKQIGEASAQMLWKQLVVLLNKIMGESTPCSSEGVRREDMRVAILEHIGKTIGAQKALWLWDLFDAFFLAVDRFASDKKEKTLLQIHSSDL